MSTSVDEKKSTGCQHPLNKIRNWMLTSIKAKTLGGEIN